MSVRNTPSTAATVVDPQDAAELEVTSLVVSQVDVAPTCTQAPQRLGSFGPRQPALPQEESQLAVAKKDRVRYNISLYANVTLNIISDSRGHKTHRSLFHSAVSLALVCR